MSNKEQPRYKVREFEWFEMETRVRQMVQELLTPFQKRLLQNSTSINNLKTLTTDEQKKLQQLRLLITSDPDNKQVDAFRTIDKKFEQQTLNILQLKNLVAEQAKMHENRFLLQDQRLKENSEILLNNMQLKERVNEQLRDQNSNIEVFRTQLQNLIMQLSTEVNKNHREQQENYKKQHDMERELEQKIMALQSIQKLNDRNFEILRDKSVVLASKDIHFQEEVARVENMINSMASNLAYTKKLAHYIEDLQEKIKLHEFNLQMLAPLLTQAQICDTLKFVLPPKMRKRLLVYENQKYGQLNKSILDKVYEDDLDRKVGGNMKKLQEVRQKFRGMELLQETHKRNTRQLIDLKRKKLLARGIDIDCLSFEMRQKYLKQESIIDENVEEEEEGQIKLKPTIDEKQITSIMKQNIADFQKQLSSKISSELADSKKFLQEAEQQLQRNIMDCTLEIDKVRQSVDNFTTDQILENKNMREQMVLISDRIDHQSRQSFRINENLFSFIQFCSLVNHLQIQDQLDKQSISLLGVKESFTEEGGGADSRNRPAQTNSRKIVDFNPQCFSCCGYPASTIAAFKMACLSYNPSDITIDEREYKREEILEIATKLLQHIKQRLTDGGNTIKDSLVAGQPSKSNQFPAYKNQDRSISQQIQMTEVEREKPSRRTRRLLTTTVSSKVGAVSRNAVRSATKQPMPANISYIFSENRRRNIAYLS